MDDFGQLVMRKTRNVFAKMWLPYSRMPNVENVFEQVMAPHSTAPMTAEDLRKGVLSGHKKICDKGVITYDDGTTEYVYPTNYVLYHEKTKKPVGKITEEEFLTQFMAPINFCETCQTALNNASSMNASSNLPPSPASPVKNIEDLKNVFAAGKSLDLKEADGRVVKINSLIELNAYLKSKNL
jgi:hypothetical protein